ncbi:hypothetical protein JCM11251_007994, partial [Rhodosporidiobolus azoricus]
PPSSSSSSSASPGEASPDEQGELSLFRLAHVPLLHGWLADPSIPSQHSVLQEAGDYDTAMTWVVEGAEIAGEGGLEWGEGGREEDMREEEVEAEVERRTTLLHHFLTTTSTQLTYSGLFALSSSPLLPPSGLSALLRNSHLSVLYRRPTPPTSASSHTSAALLSTPELFTLVTDAGFVDEPGVVWESLGDTDGEASEFWGPDLRRARVRDRERERRERAERRRREEESLVTVSATGEEGGADLALAQQLQAEEDAYVRDLALVAYDGVHVCHDALTNGVPRSLTDYSLTILNSASIIGRVGAGFVTDKCGCLATLGPLCAASGVLVFLFLPMCKSSGGLIAWCLLFGCSSGAYVSMMPSATASISKDMTQIGHRMATACLIIAIAGLTGNPICGAIIAAQGGSYTGAVAFFGVTVLVGSGFIAASWWVISRERGTWRV